MCMRRLPLLLVLLAACQADPARRGAEAAAAWFPTAGGDSTRIVARDSMVAVLFITAECPTCRVGASRYAGLREGFGRAGAAYRLVLGNGGLAAAQYARLIGAPGLVVLDSARNLFEAFRVREIPTLVLLDRAGREQQRLAPFRSAEMDHVIMVSPAPASGAPVLQSPTSFPVRR